LKNYLIGLIAFSNIRLFVAYIYGAFAFEIVYSLGCIVYKLDKIEGRLNEITKSEK
jgi:hypothetical protein